MRIDTTSASGYYSVSEEGLFQFGYSKDHRPDLPQLKVALATLDPLGLPVAKFFAQAALQLRLGDLAYKRSGQLHKLVSQVVHVGRGLAIDFHLNIEAVVV
ncbi:hypothetical protein [Salinibacter ruber]|uniref:hypothetical protein n=1 Tax=Salinibacter ruber TaxID=146919 RepID=UPI002168D9C1|nr:hypothetical protein [Salinibacter ruber]MCS4101409.1 hypothetical protein [Salinibacter ruber]